MVVEAITVRQSARGAAAFFIFVLLAGCASAGPGREAEGPADTPLAVKETMSVGDASLYLEIRGRDSRAPVLLWLHGGPGGAERPLFRYFDSGLESHFVVVYLDQRGAGKSYDPDADMRRLTVATHIADLDAVVNHLIERLGGRQVVLVGHSWGGTLGLLYAASHPSKVSMLVCVAPAVAFSEQQVREYAYDVAEARRRQDTKALRVLERMGEPPVSSVDEMIDLENVTRRYKGVGYRSYSRFAVVVGGFLRGLVSPRELVRIIRGSRSSLAAMFEELQGLDLRHRVRRLDVPVAFFLGRHDHHVDAELAAEYFETLDAPAKRLVWFERSAHDIPFDEPRLLVERVVEAARAMAR